jgi:hypothetical protein
MPGATGWHETQLQAPYIMPIDTYNVVCIVHKRLASRQRCCLLDPSPTLCDFLPPAAESLLLGASHIALSFHPPQPDSSLFHRGRLLALIAAAQRPATFLISLRRPAPRNLYPQLSLPLRHAPSHRHEPHPAHSSPHFTLLPDLCRPCPRAPAMPSLVAR